MLLLAVFLLFLKTLSYIVAVRNAAANIFLRVLCIVTGAVIVGGLLVVLHPSSLEKGEESCFTL